MRASHVMIQPMMTADWPEVVAIYKQGMRTGQRERIGKSTTVGID